jgi:hypothetical protein
MPSIHGKSFLAQWSVWRTTGLAVSAWHYERGSNVHAVCGGNGADEVSGSDGTSDGCFLLVGVFQALAAEEGSTALRQLEDDGRVDVARGLEAGVHDGGGGDVLDINGGSPLDKARDDLQWPVVVSRLLSSPSCSRGSTYRDGKLATSARASHQSGTVELTFSLRAYSKSLRTSSPVMTPACLVSKPTRMSLRCSPTMPGMADSERCSPAC